MTKKLTEFEYRLNGAEGDLEEVFEEFERRNHNDLEKRLDTVIIKMEAQIMELKNKVRELENAGYVQQGYVYDPSSNTPPEEWNENNDTIP